MLKEYKKVKHIFKRPKAHVYFGFWATPTWLINLEQWILNYMNTHDENDKSLKFRLAKFIDKLFNKSSNPFLPVWRRGHSFRLFKKHQTYHYDQSSRGYVWNEEFANKLKKWHLSWLKPEYELPLWLTFYIFSFDMIWKWKFDDVRYEYPPQWTIVLFNISFSICWTQPESKDGWDLTYWEGILNYTYKYLEKLDGKQVDTLSQIIGLSDYCGYWGGCADDKFTWVVQPDYIRNKYFAEQLKKHQDMKEKDVRERKAKITCPKCGAKMKCDDTKMLTTLPPQYEYTCPKCGEIKYLDEIIETWYL